MKKISKVVLVIVAILMVPAMAFACNYTFDVNLVSHTVLDPVRSAANTLGFDNWYIWKYRVDVVPGGDWHNGLSNWVLELPQCYVTSPNLFREIEASAAWGRTNNRIRVTYDTKEVDPDPNAHLDGLKWDFVGGRSGAQLDSEGEFGYFWFSAPTNQDIDTDWAVKAGCKEKYGETEGPACVGDGCNHPSNPGTPEPISLLLFGSGLAAVLFKKKRRT